MTNAETIRLTGDVIELKKENESMLRILSQVEPLLTFCPVCKSPLKATIELYKRGHAPTCKLWKYCNIPMNEGDVLLTRMDNSLNGYCYYTFKDFHNREIVTIGIILKQYAKNDEEIDRLERALRLAFFLMVARNEKITPQALLANMITELEKIKIEDKIDPDLGW